MGNLMCCACVPQAYQGIITRWDKFHRISPPGLTFMIPIADKVSRLLPMQLLQQEVTIETKTKDNVFVTIKIMLQYNVSRDSIYEACYSIHDPNGVMSSHICDIVRSRIPMMLLDDLFETKIELANTIKQTLIEAMADHGWEIQHILINDIEPDAQVKHAMNEINKAQRLRIAAQEKGEADRIMKVKAAEADAESKHLSGIGVAKQRKAIAEGLRDSMLLISEASGGTAPSKEIMDVLLITQYYDTLKELSHGAQNTVVFIPHDQGTSNITSQIRQGMMEGSSVNNNGLVMSKEQFKKI